MLDRQLIIVKMKRNMSVGKERAVPLHDGAHDPPSARSNVVETPSESIRRIITERNLSNSEVARLCGVPVSTISRFMRGERGLVSESFDRLCLGLDLMLVPAGAVFLTEEQQE